MAIKNSYIVSFLLSVPDPLFFKGLESISVSSGPSLLHMVSTSAKCFVKKVSPVSVLFIKSE